MSLNVIHSDASDLPPKLPFTEEVSESTSKIYDLLKDKVDTKDWELHAPYIHAINKLKKEKNAVILVHNYQTPEIFHGVSDVKGDSLLLAQEAAKSSAERIIVAGVHFMAETAKLLNPTKRVFVPDLKAGCSLADSITSEDIALLREKYPNRPVVTYINSTAAVKAASDICCTSANAVSVVESLGVPEVIFLPDEFLGKWVATQTDVKLILWKGHCEVHERFTPEEIRIYREKNPGVTVLAHPECPPEVLLEADFVGSTSGFVKYLDKERPKKVVMITECSMSDNVSVEFPEIEFTRPCNLCPHMKRISLQKILRTLQSDYGEIFIPDDVAKKARSSVERMIKVPRGRAG